MLRALVGSFTEDRALVIENSACIPEEFPDRLETGDQKSLVIARTGSALALPALVYAEATGKAFIGLTSLETLEEQIEEYYPASIIVVDDLDRLHKAFLSRMLKWSQQGSIAPVLLGIMTGQSFVQLSGVVCRLLVHRDFRILGGRLFEPPSLDSISVQDMEPTEFYVITAHGNEMHLRHNTDEIICGASLNRAVSSKGFDCEPRCPFDKRFRASSVPAHGVLVLSCDAFTLADGQVPPEFNILLNFLNGWAGAVLAPFKHVQGNIGLAVLVNALIRSGYSIGEVALRLNATSRFDDVPDYSYLVLGDPNLVFKSEKRQRDVVVAMTRNVDGLTVACNAGGALAVEVAIPMHKIVELLGRHSSLVAIDPLSETLQRPDIFFSLRRVPNSDVLSICIFGKHELPTDTLVFRVTATDGVNKQDRSLALNRLKSLSTLTSLEFLIPIVRKAGEKVLSTLRATAAYPRAVELVQGHAIVRGIVPILEDEFRGARQEVLRATLDEMANKRVWINQIYAQAYPIVRQLAHTQAGRCNYCGGGLTPWSYVDGCTDLQSRIVIICDRCGIIEDRPEAAELEIKLTTCESLTNVTHRQVFSIRNRSTRRIELSLLHQFNQWKQLGIDVDPEIEELMLAAGEQVKKSVLFQLPPDLPDGLQQMQFFMLTDRFDIHFAGQKMKSVIRAKSSIDAT
jgi:hypothetical protein